MSYSPILIASLALVTQKGHPQSTPYEIAIGHAAAGCSGKEAFESRSLAAKVASRPRRQFRSHSLTPYRCKSCSKWHIGAR